MNIYQEGLPVIHLKPGELYVAVDPVIIATVLGSCVSVTMYSPRLKISAMCHGVLPGNGDSDIYSKENFKFVDCSILYMANKMKQLGISPSELDVKLFGGSDRLNPNCNEQASNRLMCIGKQNVEKAKQVLISSGLKITAFDVGGRQGRKLFFYSETGKIFMKRITGKSINNVDKTSITT